MADFPIQKNPTSISSRNPCGFLLRVIPFCGGFCSVSGHGLAPFNKLIQVLFTDTDSVPKPHEISQVIYFSTESMQNPCKKI